MEDQVIFKAWAEEKYRVTNITKVDFELSSHGPYSSVTPDVDPYVNVVIHSEGRRDVEKEVSDIHNLVRELVEVANRLEEK